MNPAKKGPKQAIIKNQYKLTSASTYDVYVHLLALQHILSTIKI